MHARDSIGCNENVMGQRACAPKALDWVFVKATKKGRELDHKTFKGDNK